jgi:hypothetical protein
MKELLKKQVLMSVASFVFIAIIVVGSSYALFDLTSSNPTDQNLATGDLNIAYTGSSTISITSIEPMTDAVAATQSDNIYTFTVSNTGTVAYKYTISLIDNPDYLSGGASYSASMTLLNHNYIRYNLGGSNLTLGEQPNNIIYTGTINPGKSKTFTLRVWVADADTYNLPNEALGSEVHLSIKVDGKATATHEFLTDTSGANAPLLADNMIPVYYDNTNDVWKKADSANANSSYKWYDYTNQTWANAVTVTSSTRSTYNSAAVGTQIPMSDILGMWVWIPRYEYMTTNLGTQYAGGTQALPGGISIKFISGTSTTNDTNYLIHPAFRNGTVYKYSANYDLGGWDKELTGFWMGKFETGYATNFTATHNAETSNILVKPDVYSMRYQTVSNEYTTAANIQSDHGIGSTIETHMSKNDEWGAVAYLSQSTYGKYGNTSYTGANKEIYVNNAYYSTGGYFFTTGRSNGTYGGGSGSGYSQYGTYEYNNCPASSYTHTACTETVRNTNNTKGTGASTTGNIYGVYDMSGGAYEYVMANLSGTIGSSGFSSMPVQKYWNKYTSTTLASACNGSQCYGQAITETGTGANSGNYQWYNDYMYFVTSSNPWALRGHDANYASNTRAGVFSFYGLVTGGADNSYGFRASIS